ncbi:MAG: proton-conducting membrane transporter [Oscillospiraceae bacterium]|nr:proton-conducting membrane transporter [Oscillospiraceae bacterium]
MEHALFLAAIGLPLLSGAALCRFRDRAGKTPGRFALGVTLLTSLLVWYLILRAGEETFVLFSLSDSLVLCLRFDRLGRFFAGILATLWPLTVLYAQSYLEGKPRLGSFFGFFTLSYAVSLGVSMAGNLLTLYVFYELLTLATAPLVLYPMSRKAIRATVTYLIFSLGGAAFGFAAMAWLLSVGAGGVFTLGGLLNAAPDGPAMQIFFVLGFLGFGVKAAVFPLHIWLPRATVAPTPVTALLHAVAVVKAGAFAVIRLSWYCFGPALLRGTWAQTVSLALICFTLVFGSAMALKQVHWKKRLAYSTVANLSYVLFGALLLIPAGLQAGLVHMAAHAAIKILAFCCAGAVYCRTGLEYHTQLNGLGRKMPVTFAAFTLSALALTGIPPFNGFVSKWYLLTAAAEAGTPLAYVGAGALLLSALLTAIYMLIPAVRAWFPRRDAELFAPETTREADWRMLVPFVILTLALLVLGLYAAPIVNAAAAIAGL